MARKLKIVKETDHDVELRNKVRVLLEEVCFEHGPQYDVSVKTLKPGHVRCCFRDTTGHCMYIELHEAVLGRPKQIVQAVNREWNRWFFVTA